MSFRVTNRRTSKFPCILLVCNYLAFSVTPAGLCHLGILGSTPLVNASVFSSYDMAVAYLLSMSFFDVFTGFLPPLLPPSPKHGHSLCGWMDEPGERSAPVRSPENLGNAEQDKQSIWRVFREGFESILKVPKYWLWELPVHKIKSHILHLVISEACLHLSVFL